MHTQRRVGEFRTCGNNGSMAFDGNRRNLGLGLMIAATSAGVGAAAAVVYQAGAFGFFATLVLMTAAVVVARWVAARRRSR